MAGVSSRKKFVTVIGDNNKREEEEDDHELNRSIPSHRLVPAEFLIATIFEGAHRKKRNARQRRIIVSPNFAFGGTGGAAGGPSSSSSSGSSPVGTNSEAETVPSLTRSIQPSSDLEARRLKFLLQKELRHSDVSSLGRIVLPKKAAETYLPKLHMKDGIFLSMDDINGLQVWNFKYRFWPNNNSRMYILENTGEFVKFHDLRIGDYMMLYIDDQSQKFIIRGRKASDHDIYSDYRRNGFDGNYQFALDSEVNKSNYFYVNCPTMDEMGLSCFFNDTIPDHFPLQVPGTTLPNFQGLEPVTGFGSVDNLSLDDFP
ncbi:hypothetical protein MKW94_014084 [Papaver nudicaule]|uniref:TF-B3 domain-containing protein n=1 Tax=Papaver nudicaule TaxID=74823 RepID=A0AA42AYT3_PAPNU|nr:hypothetical protein [Papaver nudicaule]